MKIFDYINFLRESFTAKVFSYVLGTMVILFSVLILISYNNQKNSLRANLFREGIHTAQMAANTARLGVFTENEEQLRPLTDAILSQEEIMEVCIHNADKKMIHWQSKTDPAKNREPYCCQDTRCKDNVGRLLTTKHPFFVEHDRNIEFWHPVFTVTPKTSIESLYFDEEEQSSVQETEVIGVVSIILDKSIFKESLHTLLLNSFFTGLVFLAISVLVTLLIVRDVSAPLTRLIKKIRESGTKPDLRDNMGMLHDTFSGLIDTIDRSFATINELRTGLEKKVAIRTRELAERSDYLEQSNKDLADALRKLKEAQVQLVQSEKMAALGQLVAGVAHEINNTTNFIAGALPPLLRVSEKIKAHIADQQAGADEETGQLLKTFETLLANIMEGTKRTTKIVKDLRTFSRTDQAAETVDTIDINENLESTLTLLYTEYKHSIEIIRDFAPDLPQVQCLPGQLNQVFLNILLNAIQAIEGRGTIHIRTWQRAGFVHVGIRDNGIGIPASMLQRIFEPFFTTKEVGQGTGLGLSISYGIIKEHGGDILVSSEVGKGTEFELVLPVSLQKKAAETENATKEKL